MAEYIEREKVCELLNAISNDIEDIPECGLPQDYIEGWQNALETAVDKLKGIPTADVRPERHGTWVDIGDGYVACSECGEEHGWENYRASYCDTCGAKMSWEDNDNG